MLSEQVLMIEGQLANSGWDEDRPFVENLRACLRKALRHGTWTVTADDKFRAGIAGAVLKAKGEDKEWLVEQVRVLTQLSAAMNAAQTGLPAGGMFAAIEEPQVQRDYALLEIFRQEREAYESETGDKLRDR